MQSFFANQSCDPFSPQSTPCQLGNYVRYALNASCTTDVQLGVLFAKAFNLRLVVRNTGHECVITLPHLPDAPSLTHNRIQLLWAVDRSRCFGHLDAPPERHQLHPLV